VIVPAAIASGTDDAGDVWEVRPCAGPPGGGYRVFFWDGRTGATLGDVGPFRSLDDALRAAETPRPEAA
jgi:hypothetical protein